MLAPEGMSVDLDRVPGRRIEPILRVGDFVADARVDVGGALQPPAELQRRDARLVVGELPDEVDRIDQADEEKAGNRLMNNLQIQRLYGGDDTVGHPLRPVRETG